MKYLLTPFLALGLLIAPQITKAEKTAKQVVDEMTAAIDAGKTYKFDWKGYERLDGELKYTKTTIHVQVSPFRVYVYNHEKPHAGAQLHYQEGEMNGNAHVNPGKFLPALKLDPFGKRMRAEGHQTIFESGFQFINSIVKSYVKKSGGDYSKYFTYEGEIDFNGIPCYKVEINDPGFGYEEYTFKSGENLYKVARRDGFNEYLVLQKNDVKNFEDLGPGDKALVPTSYAKKIILYIDKSNMHPIYQEIHDDKGLFEKYLFLKVQVNPKLSESDFSIK
jgi:LysM repeat protein